MSISTPALSPGSQKYGCSCDTKSLKRNSRYTFKYVETGQIIKVCTNQVAVHTLWLTESGHNSNNFSNVHLVIKWESYDKVKVEMHNIY